MVTKQWQWIYDTRFEVWLLIVGFSHGNVFRLMMDGRSGVRASSYKTTTPSPNPHNKIYISKIFHSSCIGQATTVVVLLTNHEPRQRRGCSSKDLCVWMWGWIFVAFYNQRVIAFVEDLRLELRKRGRRRILPTNLQREDSNRSIGHADF